MTERSQATHESIVRTLAAAEAVSPHLPSNVASLSAICQYISRRHSIPGDHINPGCNSGLTEGPKEAGGGHAAEGPHQPEIQSEPGLSDPPPVRVQSRPDSIPIKRPFSPQYVETPPMEADDGSYPGYPSLTGYPSIPLVEQEARAMLIAVTTKLTTPDAGEAGPTNQSAAMSATQDSMDTD